MVTWVTPNAFTQEDMVSVCSKLGWRHIYFELLLGNPSPTLHVCNSTQCGIIISKSAKHTLTPLSKL